MNPRNVLPVLSLALLTIACADAPDPADAPTQGEGGNMIGSGGGGSSADGGAGAQGGSDPVGGGGGMMMPPYDPFVGAAYPSGDARIVLIDKTGTRSALFNPSTGGFEGADDIDELEGGLPLMDLSATALVGDEIYLFDTGGLAAIYDKGQATFTMPEPLADVLDDIPFNRVGAAFGANSTLFVFNEGGSSYAAYDTQDGSWSQVYDFVTDFGGGGAPIASVGAAYQDGNDGYVLFDVSGTSWCIYSGGGTFSDDFDIDELGNGMLTFNDD